MTDQLIINVDNAEVMQALQQLAGRLDNLQPALQDIAARLEQNIGLRFITKTDPSGKQWAPLAPSTKSRYAKADSKGNNTVVSKGSLLMRTGQMHRSLNSKVIDNAALIGFNSNIAQYHEFGTKKMPARHMMFANPEAGQLGNEDVADIMEILSHYVESQI